MKINSFTSKEHLREDDLIKGVFDKGVSFKHKSITVFFLKRKNTDCSINRVAFTYRKNLFNKKLVLRNRIKRLLKESYRKTKSILPSSYDIVILATNIRVGMKAPILEKEMANVFKECVKKLH